MHGRIQGSPDIASGKCPICAPLANADIRIAFEGREFLEWSFLVGRHRKAAQREFDPKRKL
jgi:hypothetical protein